MRMDPQSKLVTAIKLHDPSMADCAIEQGANINAIDDDGVTPLILSVLRNSGGEMTAYLISKGAEVNCTLEGYTPLIIAAKEGYLDIVQVLISSGADIEAAEETGMTSLMAAAREGHVEIVRVLLDAGAKWNTTTVAGITALDIAEHFENAEIIELLEERAGIIKLRAILTKLQGRLGEFNCCNDKDSDTELKKDK